MDTQQPTVKAIGHKSLCFTYSENTVFILSCAFQQHTAAKLLLHIVFPLCLTFIRHPYDGYNFLITGNRSYLLKHLKL